MQICDRNIRTTGRPAEPGGCLAFALVLLRMEPRKEGTAR